MTGHYCKCGAPATNIRTAYGTGGYVPQFLSCDEHVNVNVWDGHPDGTWTPAGDYTEEDLKWMSPAVRLASQ